MAEPVTHSQVEETLHRLRSYRVARGAAVDLAIRLLEEMPAEDRETVWKAVESCETCEAPGCVWPRQASRPYCSAHEKRMRRYGSLQLHIPVRRKQRSAQAVGTAVDNSPGDVPTLSAGLSSESA